VLGSSHGVVVDFAELSDPGRDPSKQINEDAAGYSETAFGHLAVVCDGMGGHSAGREASQAAVRTIMEAARTAPAGTLPGLVLKQSIEAAGRAVYAIGGNAPAELRPGSTCVAVLLHAGGAELAHAGDSRVYLLRSGRIERLTRDHSMVQELVDSGMLAEEQALQHPDANKITRALGIAPEVNVEVRAEPLGLAQGDTLLLCTDGLTDLVTDLEIQDVVARRIGSGPAVACQELVAQANARGGHDNITALIVHVVEAPPMQIAPPRTVLERALPSGAGQTLVTGRETGPAPTLFDDSAPRPTQPGLTAVDTGDRTTQPGIDISVPTPSFLDDPGPMPRQPPGTRLWMMIGWGLALTVLGGFLAWGVVKLLHKKSDHDDDELVPPPSARELPRPSSIAPLPSEAPTAAASADGATPEETLPDSGRHFHRRDRLLNDPSGQTEGP
jgi:PPM family protein phosphatase